MQINNYIKYFNHSLKRGENPLQGFQMGFQEFNSLYREYTPTQSYGFLEGEYNRIIVHGKLYNNLLSSIANYLGVKVMFKDIIGSQNRETKGYRLIGDSDRIQIMKSILEIIDKAVNDTRDQVRGKITRAQFSILISKELHNITELFKEALVTDIKYEMRLELYILNQFKLDFKNFASDGESPYYHAVSSSYHNKRMLQ